MMTAEQIEAVLDWLCGGFNYRLTDEARPVWQVTLADLEPGPAMSVAMEYAKAATVGSRFPTPGDFRRGVRTHMKGKTAPGTSIPSSSPPDWVFVWAWCRWGRDPVDSRWLPQQYGAEFEPDLMTQADYEERQAEWERVGSPKDLSGMRALLGAVPA